MAASTTKNAAGSSSDPKKPQVTVVTSDNASPHKDYYLRGGDLYFLAGKTHFRVHSYFFVRESDHWKETIGEEVAPGGPQTKHAPGAHESTALLLQETPEDFARFLGVFYNERFGIYDFGKDDWIPILRLATKWGFSEVRQLAITKLGEIDMDTTARIKLYLENGVPDKFLYRYYMELAARPKMLGREEYQVLEKDTLCLIGQAREMLRAPSSPVEGGNDPISPMRADVSPADIFDIVAKTFKLKLSSEEREEELRRVAASVSTTIPNGTHPGPSTTIPNGTHPGSSGGNVPDRGGSGSNKDKDKNPNRNKPTNTGK